MDDDREKRRVSGCIGKHRHETFEGAQRQLARGKRTNKAPTPGRMLNVYACEFCGGFHIGHSHKGKK